MMMQKGRVWLIAFFLLLIDIATKYWAEHALPLIQVPPPFYPYGGLGIFHNVLGIDFCLTRVHNLGGAWGMFASYPHILLCLRIGIILALAVYTLAFNKEGKKAFPLALILAGASGNIGDFFIYGAVVDLFHFTLWGYSYPVFNVADMLIFFGVVILALQTLKKRKPHAYQSSQS